MATAHRRRVRLESIYHSIFNASHGYKRKLLSSMSIIKDSPLSVEPPAIPTHGMSTQATGNTTNHMGAAVLEVEGITLTRRRYVTK